jgi:8-oxo-dGTP diphosphatase
MGKAKIRAAGGVVWRSPDGDGNSGSVEVAIVHRPRYDDWSIPKGKLAPGESELEGALREVFEETGFRVWPGRSLGEVHYLKATDGDPREKVVNYWAMRASGGIFTPNREVDELRWLAPEQARELVTRSTDVEILDRFVAGPVTTRTVLVVRHASAGDRKDWSGEDRLRPLDERGRRQAEELVRLLGRFDVRYIVSADNLRCVQTVLPLSESIGVPIADERLISCDGFAGNEQQAEQLIREIGDDGEAVVVCSQREVIPDLITRLAESDELPLEGRPKAKKASVWSLSFEGPKLIGLQLFAPPRD